MSTTITHKILKILHFTTRSSVAMSAEEIAQKARLSTDIVKETLNQENNVLYFKTSDERYALISNILYRIKLYLLNEGLKSICPDDSLLKAQVSGPSGISSSDTERFIKNVLHCSSPIEYADYVKIESRFIKQFNEEAPAGYCTFDIARINHSFKYDGKRYLDEIHDMIDEEKGPRSSILMFYKLSSGLTLAEISKELGISKERVRTLAKDIELLFADWLIRYEEDFVKDFFSDSAIPNEDKIISEFGQYGFFAFRKIMSKYTDKLSFTKFNAACGRIFASPYSLEEILSEYVLKCGKERNFSIDECLQVFNDCGLPFMAYNDLKALISNNDYVFPEDKKKLSFSIASTIKSVIHRYFPNGVHISNEGDMEKLLQIYRDEYGIEITKNKDYHNIITRIQTACVLVDRGTYSPEPVSEIPETLMKEISDFSVGYVNSHNGTIFYPVIYAEFMEKLNKYDITNYHALHGAIKYYSNLLDPDFVICKDYLSYRKPAEKQVTRRFQNAVKIIKDSGKALSYDEVVSMAPELTRVAVQQIPTYFPEIIKWGKTSLIHINNVKVPKSTSKIIKQSVTSCLSNDYCCCSVYALSNNIKKEHPSIYNKYREESASSLYHLAKYVCKDMNVTFSYPYIVKGKSSSNVSSNDIVERIALKCKPECKDDLSKALLVACGKVTRTMDESINRYFGGVSVEE